ncbi:hypothetical protein BJV74DRAFT_882063 [Russula compacta]|nr:hypothetical protein BJV74DRAFT_882063 [Russula compacta]
MNSPENDLASRAATSLALFNRCVLDWFGDWSDQAFYQVGMEFTHTLDLDLSSYSPPAAFPIAYSSQPPKGRYNYVTPRHYLDFISHYVRLYNEKRDELEEQQRHLHVGLNKLRDTVTQIEQLRKSLAMVTDQQEAEQKKADSIEIQAALVKQDKNIEQRRAVVMADLADAEPAVLDAQSAVSNIKRQHLQEVRTMANPPDAVKSAMESVCTILGHKIDSWRTVQGIIRRDDIIQRIVNFDTTTQMTKILRDQMKRDYLSRPTYNFENAQRASKACGPLVKWVLAQQAEQTKQQATTIIAMISELEASVQKYKEEYAILISQTQAIKSEMERVQPCKAR